MEVDFEPFFPTEAERGEGNWSKGCGPAAPTPPEHLEQGLDLGQGDWSLFLQVAGREVFHRKSGVGSLFCFVFSLN